MSETQFWTEVQEQRECKGCLLFDTTKEGQGAFCTFAFRLDIEQKDGKETCHTRRGK